MKIILNPHEGASAADLIEMVRAAYYASTHGLAEKPPGEVMAVTMGLDRANTFGIVRRKACVSVYPPSKPSDPA